MKKEYKCKKFMGCNIVTMGKKIDDFLMRRGGIFIQRVRIEERKSKIEDNGTLIKQK